VIVAGIGRLDGAGSSPIVRSRIIASASVEGIAVKSAPDDHFTAGPHRGVINSGSGHIRRTGRRPTVRVRSVSSASADNMAVGSTVFPTPHDHLTARPYSRVRVSDIGRVGGTGGCPRVGAGIISASGVEVLAVGKTEFPTPDDHFTASPDCCMFVSGIGRVGRADSRPTVRGRVVAPATVVLEWAGDSAPDDHLAASPDCSVTESCEGRIGCAGGCPTIAAGIVSASGIEKSPAIPTAPDDHFTTGPHSRVQRSSVGRIRYASGCPTIGAGIVSTSGVRKIANLIAATPDDHFTARPHCGVKPALRRSVEGPGICPRVRGASTGCI
jgi:hypothetical protein